MMTRPSNQEVHVTEPHAKYVVHFECSAFPPDGLLVLRMVGRERISQPFAFDLWVQPTGEPLLLDEFDSVLGATAKISFGPSEEHAIHGVVREITLLPAHDMQRVAYRIHVVPRFWDTHLTRGSWIYQEKTPEQIIESALTQTLPERARFVRGEDFDFELDGAYTAREYVVQYEESVFNFVARQAEHWGIFYFFDHAGEKEKIVFADSNRKFPVLEGHEVVQFQPQIGGTDPEETIFEISASQRRISHQVSVRDYNYRIPSVELVAPLQEVDAAGVGDVHLAGEHVWTPDEGIAIATLRSQEMFGKKLTMTAHSRVRGLRCGHRFTLEGGTAELLGLARDYVVVGIEHQYASATREGETVPYSNVLHLSPFEVAFRPDRVARKPHIYGVMHAKIDSEEGDNEVHVPVDEWGRYKVVMPFDVAGQTGGRASCWIRITTQAGGGGWGFAQGLHTGVEVAIYHVDGDPDRPVIAGAVSNFEQPAAVTRTNSNQAVVSSRKGIVMTFNDA
jgi:type VI secretion system secreted protein VgrG